MVYGVWCMSADLDLVVVDTAGIVIVPVAAFVLMLGSGSGSFHCLCSFSTPVCTRDASWYGGINRSTEGVFTRIFLA
jgi:hypothetical protein